MISIIKKLILMVLFISLIIIPVSATEHNISGYVTKGGFGMYDVVVHDNESIDSTTTNISGYYFLSGYTNQTSYIISVDDYGVYKGSNLLANVIESDIINHNLTMSFKTLSSYLTDLTGIVTSLTTMFVAIMAIFMEPPLSLFIGIGLFVFLVGLIGKYLLGRSKK